MSVRRPSWSCDGEMLIAPSARFSGANVAVVLKAKNNFAERYEEATSLVRQRLTEVTFCGGSSDRCLSFKVKRISLSVTPCPSWPPASLPFSISFPLSREKVFCVLAPSPPSYSFAEIADKKKAAIYEQLQRKMYHICMLGSMDCGVSFWASNSTTPIAALKNLFKEVSCFACAHFSIFDSPSLPLLLLLLLSDGPRCVVFV